MPKNKGRVSHEGYGKWTVFPEGDEGGDAP